MRNKYNLTVSKIKRLKVKDETKLCEPRFWRNNVINAWCINKRIGKSADMHYGSYSEVWIGVYDKPKENGNRVDVMCSTLGDMLTYKFEEFFNNDDIDDWKDLASQEFLLETINQLIDERILEK